MNRITILLLFSALLMGLPLAVHASETSNALYKADVNVSENGTAATTGAVVTFSANLTAYQDGAATDGAMVYNGSDVKYQPAPPGSSTWTTFVSSISHSETQGFELFLDGANGGDIVYFPGSAGMSIDDDATLEMGNNFSANMTAMFNLSNTATVGESIFYKQNAFSVNHTAASEITASILTYNDSEVDALDTNEADQVGFSGSNWRAVMFTASKDYTMTSFDIKAYRGGTITTATGSVRAESGGSPTGSDLGAGTVDVSAVTTVSPGEWIKFTLETPVALSNGVDYALVVRVPNESGGNSLKWRLDLVGAGGTRRNSADSGASWSTTATNSFYFRTYEQVYASSVTATATGLADGLYPLEISANTSHLKVTYNSVLEGSTALSGASVPDNIYGYTIGGDMTSYIQYAAIDVGGFNKGYWDWNYGITFADDSGNGNTATPTFRSAPSDLNVTATLAAFNPITQAEASSTLGDVSNLLVTAPAVIPELFSELDFTYIPAAAGINAILDVSAIPQALWWYTFLFPAICIIGLMAYAATSMRVYQGRISDDGAQGSLLIMAVVMGVALAVLGILNPIPFWPALLFWIPATAILLLQKHRAIG